MNVNLTGSNINIQSGGFIASLSISGTLNFAGTLVPNGTITNVSVSSLGIVAVAGNTAITSTTINDCASNIYTTQITGCPFVMQLSLSGNAIYCISTNTINIVHILYNVEDGIVICGSVSATSVVTDLMKQNNILVTLSASVQSTVVIWFDYNNTLVYSNIVCTNCTPYQMRHDQINGLYIIGNFNGVMTMYNLSNGLTTGTSLTSTSTSDAFMIEISNVGSSTQLSKLTNVPTSLNHLIVETTSNTIFVSLSTSSSGTVNTILNTALYTSTTGGKNYWIQYPLNINILTAPSSVITLNLPMVSINNLIRMKKLILPPGSYQVFKNNQNYPDSYDYLQVASGTASSTVYYDCILGNWSFSQ